MEKPYKTYVRKFDDGFGIKRVYKNGEERIVKIKCKPSERQGKRLTISATYDVKNATNHSQAKKIVFDITPSCNLELFAPCAYSILSTCVAFQGNTTPIDTKRCTHQPHIKPPSSSYGSDSSSEVRVCCVLPLEHTCRPASPASQTHLESTLTEAEVTNVQRDCSNIRISVEKRDKFTQTELPTTIQKSTQTDIVAYSHSATSTTEVIDEHIFYKRISSSEIDDLLITNDNRDSYIKIFDINSCTRQSHQSSNHYKSCCCKFCATNIFSNDFIIEISNVLKNIEESARFSINKCSCTTMTGKNQNKLIPIDGIVSDNQCKFDSTELNKSKVDYGTIAPFNGFGDTRSADTIVFFDNSNSLISKHPLMATTFQFQTTEDKDKTKSSKSIDSYAIINSLSLDQSKNEQHKEVTQLHNPNLIMCKIDYGNKILDESGLELLQTQGVSFDMSSNQDKTQMQSINIFASDGDHCTNNVSMAFVSDVEQKSMLISFASDKESYTDVMVVDGASNDEHDRNNKMMVDVALKDDHNTNNKMDTVASDEEPVRNNKSTPIVSYDEIDTLKILNTVAFVDDHNTSNKLSDKSNNHINSVRSKLSIKSSYVKGRDYVFNFINNVNKHTQNNSTANALSYENNSNVSDALHENTSLCSERVSNSLVLSPCDELTQSLSRNIHENSQKTTVQDSIDFGEINTTSNCSSSQYSLNILYTTNSHCEKTRDSIKGINSNVVKLNDIDSKRVHPTFQEVRVDAQDRAGDTLYLIRLSPESIKPQDRNEFKNRMKQSQSLKKRNYRSDKKLIKRLVYKEDRCLYIRNSKSKQTQGNLRNLFCYWC